MTGKIGAGIGGLFASDWMAFFDRNMQAAEADGYQYLLPASFMIWEAGQSPFMGPWCN